MSANTTTRRQRTGLRCTAKATRRLEVTRLDGKKETVHTFGWYMRNTATMRGERGHDDLLLDGAAQGLGRRKDRPQRNANLWVKWTANAAKTTHAAYIDLNEIVALEFERLGPEKVEPLFGDKRTHSTPAGALLNAQMVVSGIRSLKRPNLRKYLSKRSAEIEPAPKNFVHP